MSLAVTYATLKRDVGRFIFGLGRDSSAYTANELADIDDCIQSGLRRFYFPGPVNDFSGWSFLKVSTTLTFTPNDYDYTLPEGFGRLRSDFVYVPSECLPTIQTIPVEDLLQLQTVASVTGTPDFAAIRAKTTDGTSVQTFEVLFYPTPDDAKVVAYQYEMDPPSLSDSVLHPMGDVSHAETIRAACLAAAEELLQIDDGRYSQQFQERLISSIEADKYGMRPQNFGYCGDDNFGQRGGW